MTTSDDEFTSSCVLQGIPASLEAGGPGAGVEEWVGCGGMGVWGCGWRNVMGKIWILKSWDGLKDKKFMMTFLFTNCSAGVGLSPQREGAISRPSMPQRFHFSR